MALNGIFVFWVFEFWGVVCPTAGDPYSEKWTLLYVHELLQISHGSFQKHF